MQTKAFPTFYIRRTELKSRLAGFTLVELLVSAGISGLLLAGVLSTFVAFGREAANIRNYSDIESTSRTALEVFSREVRLAYKIGSFTANSVVLYIPDSTANNPTVDPSYVPDPMLGAYSVTYAFDSVAKQLTRQVTGSTAKALITGVEPIPGKDPFNYYHVATGSGYVDGFSTANVTPIGYSALQVKQIEINFLIRVTSKTVMSATNKVLSARFIVRNQ